MASRAVGSRWDSLLAEFPSVVEAVSCEGAQAAAAAVLKIGHKFSLEVWRQRVP
jgi:hypothetical protein